MAKSNNKREANLKGKHPTELPRLDYSTLKQAANELNVFFDRSDIDESYLIYLAASGKIKLSLATFGKPLLIMTIGKEYKENQAIGKLIVSSSLFPFLNLNAFQLMALSVCNEIKISAFYDLFVYDPYKACSNLNLLSRALLIHDNDAQVKNLNELALQKIENSKRTDGAPYIEDIFLNSKFLIGFRSSEYLSDRVTNAFDESVEQLEEDFKEVNITQNDLFIIKPELDRIISGNLRELGEAELEEQQQVVEGQKLHGKIENSYAMVVSALADLANLPIDEPHKAAEALTRHAELKGLQMPKNIKTTALRLNMDNT